MMAEVASGAREPNDVTAGVHDKRDGLGRSSKRKGN